MEKNKREIWLDYIKALAIFLVLVLHTIRFGINDNSFSIGLIFYYFGTIAIPLFFMVNGYLQLRREITYKYVFKKIFKILFVALSWNFLFAFLNLVLYGGIENFFYNTFFSFLQHGYLYQFWFLGSLIIIYLILPLLSKIFNGEKKSDYITITFILTVCCILVNLFNITNHYFGNPTIKNLVIQTFRLWTWLTYFCWGGLISKTNILEKLSKKWHLIIMIFTLVFFNIYQTSLCIKLYGDLFPENFYDSAICIFSTVLVFSFIKKLNPRENKLITLLGHLTMGIFIIHPTVIYLLCSFIPMANNIISTIIVFIISAIISLILYKIPYLNNIIKL